MKKKMIIESCKCGHNKHAHENDVGECMGINVVCYNNKPLMEQEPEDEATYSMCKCKKYLHSKDKIIEVEDDITTDDD